MNPHKNIIHYTVLSLILLLVRAALATDPAGQPPGEPTYLSADPALEASAEVAGHIRFFYGAIHDYAVRGHYAYLAQGRQLTVVSLADPAQPKTVATKMFEETIQGVAAAGNAVYLSIKGGPVILDVTNPAQPQMHASFKLPNESAAAMVLGSILLVDDGQENGVSYFYDIRDPLRPRPMGQAGHDASYATDGTKLFSIRPAGGNGRTSATLAIGDISKPGPMVATSHTLLLSGQAMFYVSDGTIMWGSGGEGDLDLSTTSTLWTTTSTLGLTTTSLGVAGLPAGATTSTLQLTTATAARAKPTPAMAATATLARGTTPREGKKPATTPTPNRAARVTSGSMTAATAATTATLGAVTSSTLARAKAATSTATLRIWIRNGQRAEAGHSNFSYERGGGLVLAQDASGCMVSGEINPGEPLLSAQTDKNTQEAPLAVRSDTTVYIMAQGRIHIFDLSDPGAGQDCGVFPGVAAAQSIKLEGRVAVVADQDGGLMLFDLANPLQPSLAGRQPTLRDAREIKIVRDRAYVADGAGGLKIFDISRAEAPRLLSALPVGGGVESIEIAGTTIYGRAAGRNSVLIIEAANPTAPVFRGVLKLPEPPQRLALQGQNRLLVADGKSGLLIFDTTVPTQPWRLGIYATAAPCLDVACTGEVACVLTDRLEIVDCTQPARPVRLGAAGASVVAPFADFILLNKQFVYAFTNGPALMHRIDISQPGNPVFISDFIEFKGDSYEASLTRPYMFISWRRAAAGGAEGAEERGVDLYDVSLPERPTRVDSVEKIEAAYGGAVSDKQAYIAAGTDGLLAVQIY